MNEADLWFNEELLNSKIITLKNLRTRLKESFDKQLLNVQELQKYWGGNSGEKAYLVLDEHKKKYIEYLNDFDNKIKYLEEVKEKHKQFDLENSSKIV